jgi:hypothetical protein
MAFWMYSRMVSDLCLLVVLLLMELPVTHGCAPTSSCLVERAWTRSTPRNGGLAHLCASVLHPCTFSQKVCPKMLPKSLCSCLPQSLHSAREEFRQAAKVKVRVKFTRKGNWYYCLLSSKGVGALSPSLGSALTRLMSRLW